MGLLFARVWCRERVEDRAACVTICFAPIDATVFATAGQTDRSSGSWRMIDAADTVAQDRGALAALTA
jgi:hypothetical protein